MNLLLWGCGNKPGYTYPLVFTGGPLDGEDAFTGCIVKETGTDCVLVIPEAENTGDECVLFILPGEDDGGRSFSFPAVIGMVVT